MSPLPPGTLLTRLVYLYDEHGTKKKASPARGPAVQHARRQRLQRVQGHLCSRAQVVSRCTREITTSRLSADPGTPGTLRVQRLFCNRGCDIRSTVIQNHEMEGRECAVRKRLESPRGANTHAHAMRYHTRVASGRPRLPRYLGLRRAWACPVRHPSLQELASCLCLVPARRSSARPG